MSVQQSANKNHQFTRKKIEQFSYGLNDVIGKGYSSQVYKGRHDITQQPVAVKVIDMKMLKNEINRNLLESEIEILKEIKDVPNVLKFYEVYTTKNNTYIITELCSSDLNKKVKEKLTQDQAFYFMDQVIQGYLQIYKKEIVHRDLKPANILLTQNDQCKIADFGFAIKNEELSKPSKYNVGSPLYMAPQSLKKNQYSYKTDLWSVGVIFFELLTGETPWKAKTEKDLLRRIETERIDTLIEKRKLNFSSKTVDFLVKSLCIDKQKRLEPSQLKRYNFTKPSPSNVLTEAKLNMSVQEKSKKPLNASISSPKNEFLGKFNFNNTNTNIKSFKNIQILKINDSIKKGMNLAAQGAQQNNETSQKVGEKLKRDKIKLISKQLISEIHFCRYLFKLLQRIRQSCQCGILRNFTRECDSVEKKYTMFIKHKIEKLISFPGDNFLSLDEHMYNQYKQSSDYKKILKISKEYKGRYHVQLEDYWNAHFDKRFTTVETISLINHMIQGFQDDKEEIERNVERYEKDVVILDYLITAKQLLEMLTGGENYQKFSRKSKIQDIVEGTTTAITLDLYRKIVERGREVCC